MAQTFVGSNNIALLHGAGQFGTRLMGGKDAASPRYIFCKLPQLTRLIFHPHDDALLEYLEVQPLPPSSPPRPLPFSQAPWPRLSPSPTLPLAPPPRQPAAAPASHPASRLTSSPPPP